MVFFLPSLVCVGGLGWDVVPLKGATMGTPSQAEAANAQSMFQVRLDEAP